MTTLFLRLLPPETAHTLVIWALHTGVWRIGMWADAIACRTLAGLLFLYAKPGMWTKRTVRAESRKMPRNE